MPEWAATLLVAAVALAASTVGFAFAQDRRITRLEERVANLGKQLVQLPKRRGD